MKLLAHLALGLALLTATQAAEERPRVVAFSTVLTEIAKRVGGEQAEVLGLIPLGTDPHEFQPRPADLKTVSGAQLILLSAKHMEGYVDKVKEATGTKGTLLQVGDQFASLRLPDANGKPSAVEDPHWWHSLDNMKKATRLIETELARLAPGAKPAFAANATAYLKELDDLDRWAKSEIAKLPRDQRKLVTSHDAFQYFARSYGFTIHPIEGITHEDQPSSKRVAELIATIRREHVRAVFLEDTLNPKVTQEITRESSAKIGGTLFADGLSDSPEGSTFAKMYRHNVTTIVEALK